MGPGVVMTRDDGEPPRGLSPRQGKNNVVREPEWDNFCTALEKWKTQSTDLRLL